MKKLLTLASKAWQAPILLWRKTGRLSSEWRKFGLRVQARLYGAEVRIGRNVTIYHPVRFEGFGTLILDDNVTLGGWLGGSLNMPILLQPRDPSATIRIGRGTAIMNGSEFIALASITVGQNCMIGPRCTIFDTDFHGVELSQRREPGQVAPVVIRDNVWFGSEVMILKGVAVGQDTVIAARSVVTHDLPDGVVAAGMPAKTIRTLYA